MILYVDASAIVKRYIRETRSHEVQVLLAQIQLVATSGITRPEVIAAIAKAKRNGVLWANVASKVVERFRLEWNDYRQLPVTESILDRADQHAWNYQLRGYDAVHLAAAQLFQESLEETVTVATFDQQLWQVAKQVGLQVWPDDLA